MGLQVITALLEANPADGPHNISKVPVTELFIGGKLPTMEHAMHDLATCEVVRGARVSSGTVEMATGPHVLADLTRELASKSFERDAVLTHALDFPVTKNGGAQYPMILPESFSADSLPFPSRMSPQNQWRWWTSAILPPCSYTAIHTDWASTGFAMAHITGHKLWMFWPPTPRNLAWLLSRHKYASGPDATVAAIEALEGLHVEILDQPSAFIIPPFTLHAVLTTELAFHVTAPVCSLRWRDDASKMLDWHIEWHAYTRGRGQVDFADEEIKEAFYNLRFWEALLKDSSFKWTKGQKAETREWVKAMRAKEVSALAK